MRKNVGIDTSAILAHFQQATLILVCSPEVYNFSEYSTSSARLRAMLGSLNVFCARAQHWDSGFGILGHFPNASMSSISHGYEACEEFSSFQLCPQG